MFVRILSESELIYEGIATVGDRDMGNHKVSVTVPLTVSDRWVWTNGNDGDIIRKATKLDEYLYGT